jgi:hypothetical protein
MHWGSIFREGLGKCEPLGRQTVGVACRSPGLRRLKPLSLHKSLVRHSHQKRVEGARQQSCFFDQVVAVAPLWRGHGQLL